jgi:hypothetical protein
MVVYVSPETLIGTTGVFRRFSSYPVYQTKSHMYMSPNKIKRVHYCILIKFIIEINLLLKPHLVLFQYMYIDYNDVYIILESCENVIKKLDSIFKEIQRKGFSQTIITLIKIM